MDSTESDIRPAVPSDVKGPGLLRWVFSLIGAASCWWMAFSLYQCWRQGLTPGHGRWLLPAKGLFILEFLLVHSGAMLPMLMASRKSSFTDLRTERLKALGIWPIVIVSLMYVLFIVVITATFHNWQLLLTFSGIMVPRWIGLAQDSDNARQQQINRSWDSFAVFFFLVVLGALLLPVVFQIQTDLDAMLAIYFGLIGLLEITSPLRTKSLLQSKAGGKIGGCLVLLLFLFVFSGMFFGGCRAIFKVIFQK